MKELVERLQTVSVGASAMTRCCRWTFVGSFRLVMSFSVGVSLLLASGLSASGGDVAAATSSDEDRGAAEGDVADGSPNPPEADVAAFNSRVRPFLTKYCAGCHGESTQEAGIRVDTLTPIDGRTSGDVWKAVLDAIDLEDMPPEDATQPSAHERREVVQWAREEIERAEKIAASTGGKVVLRRLNRSEYSETISRLLHLPPAIDPGEKLPEDAAHEGFDTVGVVQNTSARLLEMYLQTTERVLNVALPDEQPPEPVVARLEGEDEPQDELEHFIALRREARQLYDKSREFRRSDPDKYQELRKQAKAINDKSDDVYFDTLRYKGISFSRGDLGTRVKEDGIVVRLGASIKTGRIQFKGKGPGVYRTSMRIRGVRGKNGEFPTVEIVYLTSLNKHRIWSAKLDGRARDVSVERYLPEQLGRVILNVVGNDKNSEVDDPGVWVDYMQIEGPLTPWIATARQAIFGDAAGDDDARRVIERFATKAFRRPVPEQRVDSFHAFYQQRRDAGASFEKAIRDTVTAILVAPEFLYLMEAKAPGAGRVPLDDYEIATRLSYCLWSGPPDEELYGLAEQGKLSEPDVLRQQTRRMIEHDRAERFAENFVGQWLRLRELGTVDPDPRKYPEYSKRVEAAMKQESELFFLHVLRNDLPIRSLMDADFTFVNQELADLYGIDGVDGVRHGLVRLGPEARRGGLLTQGSVLTVTSDGVRTSPVKRGTFILDQILGDPPPPPPPDVPPVPEPQGTTLKERLKSHRQLKACAGCHNKIDPIGFALENFNAIGKWREIEKESRQPIDPGGRWNGVGEFSGYREFVALLLTREDDLQRCLAEKLLVYALGRPIDFSDDPHLESIMKAVRADDGKLSTLVTEIATSELFLTK